MTDEVVVEAKGRQAPLAGRWKIRETRDYVADVNDCYWTVVDVVVVDVDAVIDVGKVLR